MGPAGVPPGAQNIGSRLVRRVKEDGRKSRLVLQDLGRGKSADGGELFAATPSLISVRTILPLGSREMSLGRQQLLLVGDVTQAFPHALLDLPIWTASAGSRLLGGQPQW